MAVVFTATPNPVPFTQAQVAAKTRTTVSLSWGTGNPAVAASVYRSANAAAESVLPGAANKAASTGTVTDNLGFSDTVVYTLRDTAKRSLAQVTVRTALVVPAPPVPPPSPTQDIRDVRVIARGDVIWLRFGTGLPSSPWVELIDPSTNTLAGLWARPGVGTAHSMMFDGIGSPLRQAHEYRFRIVAERTAPVDPRTNPQLSGRIVTGTRRAVVRFGGASLAAHARGSVFGYDYSFYAAAGDVDAWTVGGHRTLADPMPAGGSIFCDEQVAIERAGRTLWASLTVQHVNTSFWMTYFTSDLTKEPSTPPPQGISGWSDEGEDVQRAVVYFECHPSLQPGPDPRPLLPLAESHAYTLGNPNAFEAYEAALFIDVTLTDGRWNFDGWSPEEMRRYRFLHTAVTQLRPGVVAALHGSRAMSTTLALSPSGHLAVTRERTARPSHPVTTTSAHLVTGSSMRVAAATTAADGSGHVAGIDGTGRVHWTSLADTDPSWTDLGLDHAGEVTLAAGADVVHVLAITADARLCHAVAGAGATWVELGDGVRSCATIGSPGAAPAVVAVFADGAVRHRGLGADRADDEGPWTELGTTEPGEVAVAQHDDGSLSVLVLADDGPVSLLGWPEYPHPGPGSGWERLGTFADLALGAAATDLADPELGMPSTIEAERG